MDIFYTEFLNCLESLHGKIKWLVASLPQQALDWPLQPGVGSLCMLISHLAGAERYWIGEVVGREQPIRRPGSVYQVTGMDSKELCAKRLYSQTHHSLLHEIQVAWLNDPGFWGVSG
jgi:hypothetical protein